MALRSRTYSTVEGLFTLQAPDMAFRKIVSVKREGVGYDIVRSGTPGNRQVLCSMSAASFTFENAFTGITIDHGSWDERVTEKIFIIWDE